MPGKLLHGFKVRAEAHAKLEEVLKVGKHPRACCREFEGDPNPYQVWSDGPGGNEPEPVKEKPLGIDAEDDALVDRLANRILEKLMKAKPKPEAKPAKKARK